MPLNIPNLDNCNFTELVKEGLSLLPHYAPEWTNHNPSDPGITLIELLAYFTEILIYRLNRVTRDNKIKFLQLLRTVEPEEIRHLTDPNTPVEAVDEALRKTVLKLREPQRAVTVSDYEKLAQSATATILDEEPCKVRTRCFVRRNLEADDPATFLQDCPGHVSVVIVIQKNLDKEVFEDLLRKVREKLEPSRLLTTRLHLVRPSYVLLGLGGSIRIKPGIPIPEVQLRVVAQFQDYFNSAFEGGPNGEGWPFGRPIYLSEIYAVLEKVEGVDYIETLYIVHLAETKDYVDDQHTAFGIQIGVSSTIGKDTRLGGQALIDKNRIMRDKLGRLTGIRIRSYELVGVSVGKNAFVFSDGSNAT